MYGDGGIGKGLYMSFRVPGPARYLDIMSRESSN